VEIAVDEQGFAAQLGHDLRPCGLLPVHPLEFPHAASVPALEVEPSLRAGPWGVCQVVTSEAANETGTAL
jgi:hypothetical protein